MDADHTRDGNRHALRIEGEMTIYRAAELRQVLLEAMERGGDLEIDLSAVIEMDTAGVQLLIAAKKTAQARQGGLRLTGHSAAVLDVLEMLNLAGHFGDPILMSRPDTAADRPSPPSPHS